MTLQANDQTVANAAKQLGQDPVLAPLIQQHGLCPLRPHSNYYKDLVRSIIGQQLSIKAAATISGRFDALFGDTFPTPAQILEADIEALRGAGLSRPKIGYIQDLARHILDGRVQFDTLDSLSNEAIIKELTAVKGIGEWTVHMFLMFCMGRLDVLAWGDLGVRSAVRNLYGLDHLPLPAEMVKIATQNNWHPYESIACWYLWRSLENEPKL